MSGPRIPFFKNRIITIAPLLYTLVHLDQIDAICSPVLRIRKLALLPKSLGRSVQKRFFILFRQGVLLISTHQIIARVGYFC